MPYKLGEGMDSSNGSKAVEIYSEAAELGSVKAMNGVTCCYVTSHCLIYYLIAWIHIFSWHWGNAEK